MSNADNSCVERALDLVRMIDFKASSSRMGLHIPFLY